VYGPRLPAEAAAQAGIPCATAKAKAARGRCQTHTFFSRSSQPKIKNY